MKEQQAAFNPAEAAMYAVGAVAGAALGVLAAMWISSAMAAQSPVFWFASRASAIVAYLLLWLSTAWGVTVSSKGIGGRISGALAYAMHNVTSWLALSFALVHALTLLGDRVMPFTLPAILIPFIAGYRPFFTGLGTTSLYVGAVVSGAFYMKKRLGRQTWRTIHGLSYAMFAVVTLHSIVLGTDTGTPVMKAIYVVAGSSVVLLTLFRIIAARSAGSPQAGRVLAVS